MQTQTNPGRILYTPDECVDSFLVVRVTHLRSDKLSIFKAAMYSSITIQHFKEQEHLCYYKNYHSGTEITVNNHYGWSI